MYMECAFGPQGEMIVHEMHGIYFLSPIYGVSDLTALRLDTINGFKASSKAPNNLRAPVLGKRR